MVVEVADVPVHGFAVLLEVVLVQRHVRLERAADHGVGHPLGGVVLHAPELVQLGIGAADGGRVVVAAVLLLHGHGFQALLGAGQGGGVAGRSQAADDDVHVVGGDDLIGGDGLCHKSDHSLAGRAHFHFLHHGPDGLGGIGGLHGAAGRRIVCGYGLARDFGLGLGRATRKACEGGGPGGDGRAGEEAAPAHGRRRGGVRAARGARGGRGAGLGAFGHDVPSIVSLGVGCRPFAGASTR